MATTAKTAAPAATTVAAPEAAAMTITPLARETLLIPIVGMTPLIVHRFSEKAKRTMLDAQQGRKRAKAIRDPESDYQEAFYRYGEGDAGGFGFPSVGFKAATISAARLYDKSVTMTSLRQCLFVSGVLGHDGQMLVPIDGEPQMREDVVRLSMSSTDLRYRPMFAEWSATLEVTFIASVLNRDSVLSLVEAGGLTVGIGEWRPERKGDFGTYCVDSGREVIVVG
jgi:hypothetical protein